MKNNKRKNRNTLIIDQGIVFDPTNLELNIIGKHIDTMVKGYIESYITSNNECPSNHQDLYQFVTTVVLYSTTKTLTLLDKTLNKKSVEEELVKGIRFESTPSNN